MGHPYFLGGRERELRELINRNDHQHIRRQLRGAACRDMDPDIFFPDEGRPDDLVLARCAECPARLACLAVALRGEEPGERFGWFGGLSPEEREDVAAALHLDIPEPSPPEAAARASHLHAAGWTVREIAAALGCSRRTVQRYLRMTAA